MLFHILLSGLPFTIFLSSALYLPFYISGSRRRIPKFRHLIYYLFTGCCVMILFATLFTGGSSFHPNQHLLNLKPFFFLQEARLKESNRMLKQLFLNLLMFVPLGLLLPIVFTKLRCFWKTVLCCFLATLLIETLQYFIGRSTDIDDILMNTFGGILGYWLYFLGNLPLKKENMNKKMD